MLSCFCVVLASAMFVANTLLVSKPAEGTPTEAPTTAKNASSVMPPDRGDRVAPLGKVATAGGPPITIVTGGQLPVEPLLAAASPADGRRSTPYPGSASGPSSAAKKFVNFDANQEREEDGDPLAVAKSTAGAARYGSDEQEEKLDPLGCIPCDAMFRKVEETEFGTKVQNVTVQVRTGRRRIGCLLRLNGMCF